MQDHQRGLTAPPSTSRIGRLFAANGFEFAILLVAAFVLGAGLDWGLPSRERVELLAGRSSFSDSARAAIDRSVESYFQERSTWDRAALDQLWREGNAEGSKAPAPEPHLSEEDRIRALRRYLVGSVAIDERGPYIALARMHPGRLDFDPHGCSYGGAYLYTLGGWLFTLDALGLLRLQGPVSRFIDAPEDVAAVYVAGRSLSLVCFLATGVVLCLLGRAFSGRLAGRFALASWMLASLPLNHALVTKPHDWSAFWSACALLPLAHSKARGRRALILSGIAAGLALGGSVIAAAALLVPLALLFDRRQFGGTVRAWAWLAGTALAVALLTNPYVLLDPEQSLGTLAFGALSPDTRFASPAWSKLVEFLHAILVQGSGFPLGPLAVLAAVLAIRIGDARWRRLAVGWFAVLLFLGPLVWAPRLAIFSCVPLALFAGRAFEIIWLRVSPRWLAVSGIVLVLLLPLWIAARFAEDTLRDRGWIEPTRAWIAGWPERPTIGMFGFPEPTNTPPLPFLECEVTDLLQNRGDEPIPDYVLLGNFALDRARWERHPYRPRYRLAHVLGWRSSFDAWMWCRMRNESRLAGWVFERVE